MPIQAKQQPPYYQLTERTTTFTLTNDQIKNLPTTPIQLLPAPGTGKTIKIISAFVVINTTAGAYAGTTNASVILATEEGGLFLTGPIITHGILNTTGINIQPFPVPYSYIGTGSFAAIPVNGGSPIPLTDFENKPVIILDEYATAGIPYTGGNAANTIKIYLTYITVTL